MSPGRFASLALLRVVKQGSLQPHPSTAFKLRGSACIPKIAELFDSRWPIPGKMIICVGVDQDAAFLDLVATIDPSSHVLFAVNDNLVGPTS
jgi:hypothetical protein